MKISVIIPVYNREKYLPESIESVLKQELPADEIIVIDDGSSDGSAKVARGYKEVSYHYQDNQGIGGARNTGVMMSSGDVLTFLDSDDLWPVDKLKCQIEALQQKPGLDMVFGLTEQFYSPELNYSPPQKPPVLSGIICGTMAIRRASFDKVGFFDTSYDLGEFIDWYARAQELGLTSAVLPRVMLKRRLHNTNIGVTQKDKRGDYARILKAALDRRRSMQYGGSAKADRGQD